MANVVEVVNDITGETQHLDAEMNFLDPQLYGNHITLSDAQTKAIRRETKWLLHQYGYNTESIDAALDEWVRNKGWIMNLMSRHPQYDANKFMIKYETEVERHISKSGIKQFCEWAREELDKLEYWNQYKADITLDEYEELCNKKAHLHNIYREFNNIKEHLYPYKASLYQENKDDPVVKILVNGKDKDYYYQQMEDLQEKIDKYYYNNGKIYKLECRNKYRAAESVFVILKDVDKQFIDEEIAESFNGALTWGGFETEAKKGQKVSKLISKFCIEIGMDKVKHIQQVTFTDQSGVEHTKDKDMGFNYHFYSVFADAINPTKKKMWVCFSVNPIDYLTMSFGNSWASCHTIDVDQLRKQQGDGSHNYHGMYSSGTMSYALDSSSIIMYYVNPESKDELENGIANPELKDKFKRCMFYIGENKFIQSRVYPDGRNKAEGTDEDDIATQLSRDMRMQFEEMISRCMNVPNNWVYKAGTSTAAEMSQSAGTHYRDYTNYSDCGTVFLRIGPRLVKNINRIKIGHDPICPCCGEEHSNQDNIQCCDCITRDPYGKLVTKIAAYKYGYHSFRTYEDRKEYIQDNCDPSTWDDIWDICADNDAKRLKELSEDNYPTTPFNETKSETENVNESADSDSAVA